MYDTRVFGPKTDVLNVAYSKKFYLYARKFNALWSVEVQADSLSTSYFLLSTISR